MVPLKKKISTHKTREELREFIINKPENPDQKIMDEYDESFDDGSYDVYANKDNDAENIIADLAKTDFKETNNDQSKGIQVLRFLAESDENTANEFMQKLSDKYSEVAKDMGII